MSIVLLLGALHGLIRAAMLCFVPVNRVANRLLAGLVCVLALFMFPYIASNAGYDDAHRWLSYFPFNLTLAAGPLLYLYAGRLIDHFPMPPRWQLHLLPAVAQLLYHCAMPVPFVGAFESALMLVSLLVYWSLSWRRLGQADGDKLHEWARKLLIAFGLTITFWIVLLVADYAQSGLNDSQRFPFYLWLAILVSYVGIEGHRHGREAFQELPPMPESVARPVAEVVPINLAEQGERWRQSVIAGRWWRDPELNLAEVAKRLGTNTTTLSRAINEGLGLNFNEMINRMRVDAIIEAMRLGDEQQAVLEIALSEGFNSKASFNRAFKLYTGETPTEYRRRFG